MSIQDIPQLLDQYESLVESPRNRAQQALWVKAQPPYDKFRSIPRPGAIPIIADINATLGAKIFNFSVARIYTDPDTYLEYYLRMQMYQFTEIGDDTALYREIPIWLSAPFEDSLFGLLPYYSDDEDPWVGREPVINSEDDLDQLPPFDFHSTGLMPLAHQFYERISERVADRGFTVGFPQFRRSPFGIATHVRGLDRVLLDFLDNPGFARRLLRTVLDVEKEYWKQRMAFTGSDRMEGYIANDEVNIPIISPRIYEEVLFPLELELGRFCGGFTCFHSCGNLTRILPVIRRLPITGTLHISPWTNLGTALDIFDDTALDIALNPADDILRADAETMENRMREIMELCRAKGAHAYYMRAGSLHRMGTLDEDLAHIRQWVDIGLHLSRQFMPRDQAKASEVSGGKLN